MPLFGGGADRDARQRAAAYVRALWAEPTDDDVRWLAETATAGDTDHARWELRYARRALGLLVAQRDALDDRTASLTARELAAVTSRDPAVAVGALPLVERQFNDRLASYRDAFVARSPEPVATRLGRVLLVFAGSVRAARGAGLARGAAVLARYLDDANLALQQHFGTAALPEDEPPSALAARGR